MKIDNATALKLYFDSKTIKPWIKKPIVSHEEIKLAILGVPCVVDFGFTTEKDFSPLHDVTKACAWIFSDSSSDIFFGSYYLTIDEDAHAPSILNWTIDLAIDLAKESDKFRAMKAAHESHSLTTGFSSEKLH
jgi:hypothetical protein